VNGEAVDPETLDRDPFIRQVMADAEQIAQEEQAVSPPPQAVSIMHVVIKRTAVSFLMFMSFRSFRFLKLNAQ